MENQEKADALAELHKLLMTYYDYDSDEVFAVYLTLLYNFVDMEDIALLMLTLFDEEE